MSFIIGISGGSGSGKSSFIRDLLSRFDAGQICVITQDDYYKPREEIKLDENGINNFDVPDAFFMDEFERDIKSLKAGNVVERKEYTFNNKQKEPKLLIMKPAPIIIVEGIFVFYDKVIYDALDLRLIINAKVSDKIIRRILRDRKERNYPLDDVLYRYKHHVMPAYERYIRPYKDDVDLIVNNSENYQKGLDVISGFLKNIL